jgi:hypothetical protein
MKRLEESEWKNLLREIHASQVIPVIGPELISCQQENSLHCCSLYAQIAPKLAEALGLKDPANHTAITTVTRSYLQQGGRRDEIYQENKVSSSEFRVPREAFYRAGRARRWISFRLIFDSKKKIVMR